MAAAQNQGSTVVLQPCPSRSHCCSLSESQLSLWVYQPTAYAQSFLVASITAHILPRLPIFPPLCPTSNIITVHSHTRAPRGIFQPECFSDHGIGLPTCVSYPQICGTDFPSPPPGRVERRNNVKKQNFLWKCARKSKKAAVG